MKAIFHLLFLLMGLSLGSTSFASCRDIQLAGAVDADALWQDFATLASTEMQGRKTGTPGSLRAREYIADKYQKLGLQPLPGEDFFIPFTFEKTMGNVQGVNVAGWLKGNRHPERFIVITAHYDHLGKKGGKIYYGADDNASGVAAMLSMARALRETGAHHSVIFLATDAEEKGLYGAKAFVASPPVALSKMRFNLNLDMLSQGGRKKALYVSGRSKHQQLQNVIKEVKQESPVCLIKGHRAPRSGSAMANRSSWRNASDHAAFARKDIPFLFVGVSVHPDYHTPQDTAERIDKVFYTGAVETSLLLLKAMDRL